MTPAALRAAARLFVAAELPIFSDDLPMDGGAAVVCRVPGGWIVRVWIIAGWAFQSVFVGRCGCTRRPLDSELLIVAEHAGRPRWVSAAADVS